MIICIDQILTPEQLERIRNTLDGGEFQDGRSTAGWHAKLVKNNEQLKVSGGQAEGLRAEVEKALTEHPLFQMSVRPAKVTPLIFSRYRDGMTYGNHVDDPVMGRGAGRLRTDVSFTLFLDDPDSYDGGELVVQDAMGEQRIKLPAGDLVMYPGTRVHRVEPVTRGARLACFFWVESMVRSEEHRRLLFDLDMNLLALRQRHGETPETTALTGTYHNLLRLWANT